MLFVGLEDATLLVLTNLEAAEQGKAQMTIRELFHMFKTSLLN